MNMNIYFFLFWCFVVCINYLDFTNALIGTNVRLAKEQEFPSVVSLVTIDSKMNSDFQTSHFCTGMLITNRDVLTAEHCLESKDMQKVRLIIGSVDLRNGKIVDSMYWISYNKWAEERNVVIEFPKNDIAIIRLSKNISDQIKPSAISNLSSTQLYGSDVVLAGWGSSDVTRRPLVMETATLKVLSNKECENRVKQIHGKKIPFHIRFLCTVAVPSAILTYGDSGGPLFHNNMIIGVNMGTCLYRGQTNHPGRINLHTGTDYYRNFIEDFINTF